MSKNDRVTDKALDDFVQSRVEAMSDTLTDFLLARIAEDEATARDTQWLAFDYGVDSVGRSAFSARVLAECEAKRRIVGEWVQEQWVIKQGHLTEWKQGGQAARQSVLCTLGTIYADHADHAEFQEEWKP